MSTEKGPDREPKGLPEARVRKASSRDAATVGRLLYDFNREFETPTPTAEQFATRFEALIERDDVSVLLSESHAEALGFAFLTMRPTPYGDGPLVQLEELYVEPRYRNRGVGTTLLHAALAEASARDAVEMHINVDEDDVDTRRFYERYGFVNLQPGGEFRMLCYLREL